MKRKFIVGLTLAILVLSRDVVFATAGVSATFVGLDSGSGNVWYDCNKSSALADFNGANLGSFTEGDSLVLSGGEVETYDDGPGGWDDATGASVFYRVYEQGGTPIGFTEIALGFTANEGFQDAAGDSYFVGGAYDQKWAQIASTPDLLSGLSSSGTYIIDVFHVGYFQWGGGTGNGGGEWTDYINRDGNNFTATFGYTRNGGNGGDAIPEPASAAMTLLGAALLVVSRRFRRSEA